MDYKVLFNHDGFCVYSNASQYQDIHKPVSIAQAYGYVDEVADAGCDVLMLCPNMYLQPGWDSDHYPYWREEGKTIQYPDTIVGKVLSRCRDFILSGNDLIKLSQQRAKEKGIAFFITWRMNESHGVAEGVQPGLSKFWHEHPEWRNGRGSGKTQADHALCFAHPQVRQYQLGFIRELAQRYEFEGMELDFLRFPFFFPAEMPYEEKAPILTEYVRSIKNVLRENGKDIPLVARVHNSLTGVRDMGLDLKQCVKEGLIDMINISPFFITQSDCDVEHYRQVFPDTALYVEMTHCIHVGKHLELSAELSRKITREMLHALTHSFLARGADGISLFNYTYTRDYSFENPDKLDRLEPDYQALQHITDPAFLARQPKHYFVGANRFEGKQWSKQLPATLSESSPLELKIHIGDENPAQTFRKGLVRLFAENQNIENNPINATLAGKTLEKTVRSGELFDHPYRECIPETHTPYKDFVVPLELLQKGWNTFTFRSDSDPVKIHRMELGLYL